MDLSIIILNYNTKQLLDNCLASIKKSKTSFQLETIVADNGSTDGSLEMLMQKYPDLILVDNGSNLGFAKGNNQAIKIARGRFILLLNSDTTVEENTFDKTIKYLNAHPEVGAMGGKVLLPDGTLDKACRRKFPNPANSFLRLFGLKKFSNYNIAGSIDEEMEVDAVMGAFMVVPKTVIDKVGTLDEEYFMYGEDLDWCWRIKQAGYKVIYNPKAQITHYKYGSSQNIPFKIIQYSHDAMKIFYKKVYAQKHSALFNIFVYAGINLRMSLVMLRNLFSSRKSAH